jgi:hypothetical protein
MGHRDFKTTFIYADYAPSAGEADLVDAAFGASTNPSTNARPSGVNSDQLHPLAAGQDG